jgi:hypothetical protein
MPNVDDKYEIPSNEMQEIIGQVPHWITQWGISILFVVAVIGLSISNNVSYPEVLNAEAMIQAKEQPGKVTVRREDASQEFILNIKEGQLVNAGDTLLIHKDNKENIAKPIITPMAGTIYISKGIDDKNTRDYLIWVVPTTTEFEIKINYSNIGSGKVKVGLPVFIKLQDFPSDEFGFLEGRITSIVPVSVNNQYQAYVELDHNKSLVTSRNIELPIQHIMLGSAEILLNERSILQRIFGSLI